MNERTRRAKPKTFDTALPQDWFDRFQQLMKEPPRDVVWSYDPPTTLFGLAYPLTDEAETKVLEFEKRGGTRW